MEDSTQERELIAPDEPVTSEDTTTDRYRPDNEEDDLPGNNQNDIQDAQIMPLQADDTSEAAMTMMRAEADDTETNGTEPNDMLLFGGIALGIVLLIVLLTMLLKRKPSSKNDTEANEQ